MSDINTEIFESTESAVNLSLTLLGTICLWNGIMEIASKTKLINKINNALSGVMKFLFPDIKKEVVQINEPLQSSVS